MCVYINMYVYLCVYDMHAYIVCMCIVYTHIYVHINMYVYIFKCVYIFKYNILHESLLSYIQPISLLLDSMDLCIFKLYFRKC